MFLGEIMPAYSGRILLILDLDETLVHACDQALERPADYRLFGYHVYRRPHLDDFIVSCGANFDLAVWSSADDEYVHAIVDLIFPDPGKLEFVWGRSRATLPRIISDEEGFSDYYSGHMQYIKPLDKVARLGWSLERMLIVDDTPRKSRRNYGNAIYPSPFEGDPDDVELPLLARYLRTLKDTDNVRRFEKRMWRQFEN